MAKKIDEGPVWYRGSGWNHEYRDSVHKGLKSDTCVDVFVKEEGEVFLFQHNIYDSLSYICKRYSWLNLDVVSKNTQCIK